MNKFIAAVAAAGVFASASAYAATPFDGAYGNTVTQTVADGTKIVIYVNADGTWQRMIGSQVAKGTYTWKDATHACFVQTDPALTPDQAKMMGDGCNDFAGPAHVAGDTWTQNLPNGQTMTVSITAGR